MRQRLSCHNHQDTPQHVKKVYMFFRRKKKHNTLHTHGSVYHLFFMTIHASMIRYIFTLRIIIRKRGGRYLKL